MITDQTPYQEAMTILVSLASITGIALFYFKFKRDEKAKSKRKGKTDIVSDKPGAYQEVIDDYPVLP